MGIDLGTVIEKRPTTASAWAGKWVAFDAWNVLYQFLASIRGPDGQPLKDRQGNITSHLSGVLQRTASLVEAGIKPVWVFDGRPHPLKEGTLAARRARKEQAQIDYDAAVEAGDMATARVKAQQTSRLTSAMADEAMDLLGALGMPVVQAPMEGEAQCAVMASRGDVAAVASQDYDTLLFGAPVLLRNLTVSGRRKLPGKQVWVDVAPERIDLAPSLEALGLDRARLIDAALLVGTDFCPGIKGIGAKKAVALVKESGLEAVIERLQADPASARTAVERGLVEQHEALAERDAVRDLFTDPPHTTEYDLDLRKPDVEAVLDLMVKKRDFNQQRVEAALDRYEASRGKADQQSLFDF